MPAKPCCGYPSRTDAVVALRAAGLNTRQIAAKVGIDTSTVSALEANRRSTRPAGRIMSRGTPLTHARDALELPPELVRSLRPHAARRETTVPRLVLQLLTIMADDDLVDALLDDAEEIAA